MRDVVRGLALAMVLALAIAVGLAVVVARDQGYWAAGYYRLVVAVARARFDLLAPGAAALALVYAAFASWRRRRRGDAPPRVGVATVALACVLAFRVGTALEARHAPSGPNLLLISIDTLRADRLGAYGCPLPTSPTIDARLAAEGVTFTDVYSQSPKTTPSHMTLFTSLYPSVHGIELWENDGTGHVLNPAVHTLAEVLKNAGYATGAFTGGAQMDHSRGFDAGFDVYVEHGQKRRALKWLGRHAGEPFFLFYHTYDVHDPYLPPDEYVRLLAPDYRGHLLDTVHRLRAQDSSSEEAWMGLSARFWQNVDANDPRDVEFVARLYDAGIRRMDEVTVAPLLARLDELDLARDTLVVFTSDHGEAFGEHGRFQHGDLYRETLHVPLVLRLPGRLPAGRRIASRVRLLDVMPTILALLGVPAPPAVQGQSLVPLLDGAPATSDVAISEYGTPGHELLSVRRGALSYLIDGNEERLFDLSADAGERENVVAARPGDAAALRDVVEAWRVANRPLAAVFGPRDGRVAPSADTARRLRALGYVD